MNAERLHAVARAIKDELEALSVVAHLDALVAGLQGLTSQPTDAAAQQQLSDARTALQRLATAPSIHGRLPICRSLMSSGCGECWEKNCCSESRAYWPETR